MSEEKRLRIEIGTGGESSAIFFGDEQVYGISRLDFTVKGGELSKGKLYFYVDSGAIEVLKDQLEIFAAEGVPIKKFMEVVEERDHLREELERFKR